MSTRRKIKQSAAHPKPGQSVPNFDAELFELRVNGMLVKRFDIRATNQARILTAFQEESWPRRIDDPLPPHGGDRKARLRSAIHSLNRLQHPTMTIRFFSDGTGQGIRWELASPPTHPSSERQRSREIVNGSSMDR